MPRRPRGTGSSAPAQDLAPYEQIARRGQPNGYASLDAGGRVPSVQVPPVTGGGGGGTTPGVAAPPAAWSGSARPIMSRPPHMTLAPSTGAGERLNTRYKTRFPQGAGHVIAEVINASSPATSRVTGLPGAHSGAGGFDDPAPNHVAIRLALELPGGKIVPFYAPRSNAAPEFEASPDFRPRTLLVAPGEVAHWDITPLDLPPWASTADDCWVRMWMEPRDAAGAYLATGVIVTQASGVSGRGDSTWHGVNEPDRTLATGTIAAASGSTGGSTENFIAVQIRAAEPFPDVTVSPYNRGVIVAVGDSETGGSGAGFIQQALADNYGWVHCGRATEIGGAFAAFDDRTEYRRRMIRGCTHAIVEYFTNDLTSAKTVAQLTTLARQITDGLRRYGVEHICWCTLLPEARADAGNYAVLTTQHLDMGAGQRGPMEQVRQDWNALLTSGAAIVDAAQVEGQPRWFVAPPAIGADVVADAGGILEFREASSVGTDTPLVIGKWRTDAGGAVTDDGLHPNALGQTLMANVMQAYSSWYLI